ncbi:hypothetical protein [Rhodococcus koreensis]|uniref:DUF3263 domain-containing protein n=1 Tax=Rhodococcus koreensis TaxID=99653 RepID=A0A1H4X1K0_9NOCA|nr:hypothetical protein [Rhodococcus koreensis]SEC99439.1 hypothetical protein SAMN04490239_6314 [Rhodococcus koreensis]
MDTYDPALLDFALRWSFYGGGDDYVFTEFGISPATFYQRVLVLVEKRFSTFLDTRSKEHLRRHCTEKLLSMEGQLMPLEHHLPSESQALCAGSMRECDVGEAS